MILPQTAYEFILTGEYQNLRDEAEMLKLGLAKSVSSSKIRTSVDANNSDSTKITWQSLDWTKLHM